jgi:hypothetical protein
MRKRLNSFIEFEHVDVVERDHVPIASDYDHRLFVQ